MKSALVTSLVLTATFATVTIAQEGGGYGPPDKPVIVRPQPMPSPKPTGSTAPRAKAARSGVQ